MTENILLQKAIEYTERGWYVFPTREVPSEPFLVHGKEKVLKVKSPYTGNGFKESTLDKKTIERW